MLTPETILQNRYLVMNLLAQGGMGAVYQAKDQRLGNIVALKETFFNSDTLSNAFEREARLLADLRHTALPVVSDHFKEGDGQFLVMQFIPGDDLAALLERDKKPFAVKDVLQWADRLLDALDYLHTHEPPIIHRDIKPQNLKLTSRGEVVLLDFGLAKGAAHGMTSINSNQSIHGYTAIYAPLEQIQGGGTEARSDLYSLAATFYHLLTGVAPADALTRAEAILDGKPDPLVPLTRLNPQIPPAVNIVLLRAMSMRREQRYLNAAEMRRALQEAAGVSASLNNSAPSFASPTVLGGTPTRPNLQSQQPVPPVQSTQVFSAAKPVSQAQTPTIVGATTLKRNANSDMRSPATRFPGTQPYNYDPASQKSSPNLYIIGGLILLVATLAVVIMTRKGADKTVEYVTLPNSSGANSNPSTTNAADGKTDSNDSGRDNDRMREASNSGTPSVNASQPSNTTPQPEKSTTETAQQPSVSETPQTAASKEATQTSAASGSRTPSMVKQGDGKLPTPDPPAQSAPKPEEPRPSPSYPMGPPPPPPPPHYDPRRPPPPHPGRPPHK